MVLVLAAVAYAAAAPAAAEDAAAPVAAPAKSADAPVQPAAAQSGCKLSVGSSSRDVPSGSQVCWRPPEYLTCVGNGNWAPKFCPDGQKCQESGGKITCVQDPSPPELPLEQINSAAASKIDKAKVLDRK